MPNNTWCLCIGWVGYHARKEIGTYNKIPLLLYYFYILRYYFYKRYYFKILFPYFINQVLTLVHSQRVRLVTWRFLAMLTTRVFKKTFLIILLTTFHVHQFFNKNDYNLNKMFHSQGKRQRRVEQRVATDSHYWRAIKFDRWMIPRCKYKSFV